MSRDLDLWHVKRQRGLMRLHSFSRRLDGIYNVQPVPIVHMLVKVSNYAYEYRLSLFFSFSFDILSGLQTIEGSRVLDEEYRRARWECPRN